jgi:hypothetical protein
VSDVKGETSIEGVDWTAEGLNDGRVKNNKELCDFYSSASIIRVIKSRRIRWAGRVAQIRKNETRMCYCRVGQRERDH